MSRPSDGPPRPSTPEADSQRLPASPPCPFCQGRETELVNPFGAHASVSAYWCRDCRSPFELLKWSRTS